LVSVRLLPSMKGERAIIRQLPEQSEFEVKSNEAGAFFAVRRDSMAGPHADAYWNATLSCGSLQASLRFYEIRLGGLAEYFERLAREWRGWKGERRWASLEDDVELVATHNGLGTITLGVRLRTEAFAQHRWSASSQLLLDAGALDRLAREARRLL
jgi:hypothetical protein